MTPLFPTFPTVKCLPSRPAELPSGAISFAGLIADFCRSNSLLSFTFLREFWRTLFPATSLAPKLGVCLLCSPDRYIAVLDWTSVRGSTNVSGFFLLHFRLVGFVVPRDAEKGMSNSLGRVAEAIGDVRAVLLMYARGQRGTKSFQFLSEDSHNRVFADLIQSYYG